MDALGLLTADHNRVRGLFTRFRQAQEDDDASAMADLASRILDELTIHATIEEEIFYPAVHDTSDEVAEVVDEGIEEHHVAKVLMAELVELEPGSDRWVAKMTVLMESVEHHAEEEEQELFRPLRSELDAGQLGELGDQLEAGKAARGATVLADKEGLTKAQLAGLARDQAIPGRSKMDKEELAATVDVELADEEPGTPATPVPSGHGAESSTGDGDRGHLDREAAAQGAIDDADLPAAERVEARRRVREEADVALGAQRPPGPTSS